MLNRAILQAEVQSFLQDRAQAAPQVIALGKSPFGDVSPAELAAQIDARQRSRHKLPLWFSTPGIYFPAKLSIEQCSSEATARYKTGLLAGAGSLWGAGSPPAAGLRILDMTGGLGVDSTLFARAGHRVTHCERDPLLSEIAYHNAGLLGAGTMEFVAGDGINVLKQAARDRFDVIYLDPARRIGSQKTFRLSECEPNILDLHGLLLEKCSTILLKLSPMLDIRAASEQIPGLQEIHVLSVDGECKELVCRIGKTAPLTGSLRIIVAALTGTQPSGTGPGEGMGKRIAFTVGDEKSAEPHYASPRQYLYEPDAALLKSGAFKWTGQHFGLAKLHRHTHLYTSDTYQEEFIGKITKITATIPYPVFKKSKQALSGNVIARNFPMKAEEIRQKHRIGENAAQNLYFCTDPDDRLIVIQTTDTP